LRTDQISEDSVDTASHDADRQLKCEHFSQAPGRSQSFEEFYESAYPRLLRLGVALVWSKTIAEDHVQDAFAKTYARYATLDEPEAYVRKTLVNEVRISFRRAQMSP
jgi:DNA-directed RNA polymerase specialized sigma24 family protein